MIVQSKNTALLYMCFILACFGCNDVESNSEAFSEPAYVADAGEVETQVGCNHSGSADTQDCSPAPEENEDNISDCEIDWFFDRDDDGFGGELAGTSCAPLEDTTSRGGDCDDDNPMIHPNSNERIDGVDANCNGRKDWLVKIYVAVDDAGELCINDESIGDTGTWNEGTHYETWLTSGAAAIGIFGWDVGYHITAAIAHVELSDGTVWTTDSSWVYSPDPNEASSKVGWCTPEFDDSGWQTVQDIGPIGTSPWGASPAIFPQESPARWIWDHFPVELNSQYLRKVIMLP